MNTDNAPKLLAELAKIVLDDPAPDLFLSHIVTRTLAHLDCRGAILGLVQREGFLDLHGTYGYKESQVEPYMRIPLWTPMPVTDAVRTGELVFIKTVSELSEKYPHLGGMGFDNSTSTIAIPISYRSSIIGALGLTTLTAPNDDFQSQPFAQGLISLTGLYIRNLVASKPANSKDINSSAKALTPRQKQIIELFEEELTTDQMADKLRYSASTIKQDIIKIYGIFGVNNRRAVIELAKKAGII